MMARKKDMWDGNAEFSFNISEEEFNKRHKKARKDAEPSGKKKKKEKEENDNRTIYRQRT